MHPAALTEDVPARPAPTAAAPAAADDPARPAPASARTLDPVLSAIAERHNRRIGSLLQRLVETVCLVYVLGPFLYAALRVALRVRVSAPERLDRVMHGPVIFACRHQFEWDTFVLYFGGAWRRALRRPHLSASTLVGSFWMRTRVRRAFGWCFGFLGLLRGEGDLPGGLARAIVRLRTAARAAITIMPTGPLGRKGSGPVRPGVARLALACPDVPIVPVGALGIRELRLRDVLGLRRPAVAIAFGEPFRARDIEGADEAARIQAICATIERRWHEAEAEAVARAV